MLRSYSPRPLLWRLPFYPKHCERLRRAVCAPDGVAGRAPLPSRVRWASLGAYWLFLPSLPGDKITLIYATEGQQRQVILLFHSPRKTVHLRQACGKQLFGRRSGMTLGERLHAPRAVLIAGGVEDLREPIRIEEERVVGGEGQLADRESCAAEHSQWDAGRFARGHSGR